ncbi:2-hydroxychromene-2-carboxylate isomerase [Marilutibacter chinensis]|uniref:2-hydroxychromene-2-carboxylate isomerase n=1 Tax=Marilutibacter chinensis TaxID=2912247 RepID=A0ABS9HTF0_9GAMM|nr:2-hydroxychromene-2-carboxylate isomerase [Lysobacter chinensis]MCF7222179.1 2-hydroxychromene-2-carboxylate isomerase [Lysobacter chinensis]
MPLTWYFDFISPFAYLQWQKIKTLHDSGVAVEPVPIVFAAVLSARGQKGPAEIPGKREFTYRHVLWQAVREGIELRFPPAHPFNPLPSLRLCIAAGSGIAAVDAIFDRIWRQGEAVDSAGAIAPLARALGIPADAIDRADVKDALRANTGRALDAGVYGVPTLAIGDQLFWGNDAHDFAMAVLADPALPASAEMQRVSSLPVGVQRRG